jgi:hypothetical protein
LTSPLSSKSLFANNEIGIENEASRSGSIQFTLWAVRSAGEAALATKPAIPSA